VSVFLGKHGTVGSASASEGIVDDADIVPSDARHV